MSQDKKNIPASLQQYLDTIAGSHVYPDLHQHVLELWRKDLLLVIDEPINKDTEMHPLVRWQYKHLQGRLFQNHPKRLKCLKD